MKPDSKRALLIKAEIQGLQRRDTKPVRRAAPQAGAKAGLIVAKIAQKTRFADPGLVNAWSSIVGREIAGLCRPGKISGRRSDRTFEVHVAGGAAATAVGFEKATIIDKLNAYYGPGSVGRLHIRQTAATRGDDDRQTQKPMSVEPAQSRETPPSSKQGETNSRKPAGGLSRFRGV